MCVLGEVVEGGWKGAGLGWVVFGVVENVKT